MKIILITTTIRVPKVLALYRQFSKDVQFIVIGDKKTPHVDVAAFVGGLGNALYYSVRTQENLGYKCSEVIGWNKITRRNIGVLEALRLGADIIVSVNDDDIPLSHDYFNVFEHALSMPYDGVEVSSANGWVNTGQFSMPSVYHRGFPISKRDNLHLNVEPLTGARIGVAEGGILGDPDVDAVDRIASNPKVQTLSELGETGIVVASQYWCPFNNENTAYVRELAPLMMLPTDIGRHDDIFASYMTERIMRETGHRFHYGYPTVWQERNPHDLTVDLGNEIFGMEHTMRFVADLDAATLGAPTVIGKLAELYEQLQNWPQITKLGKTWLKDLERVL